MSINRHTDKMGVGHTRLGFIGHLHSPSCPPLPVSFLGWQQTTCRGWGGSVPQLYLHFLQTPLNLVGDSALFLSMDSQCLLLTHSCFFLIFSFLFLKMFFLFLLFSYPLWILHHASQFHSSPCSLASTLCPCNTPNKIKFKSKTQNQANKQK